MLVIEQASSSDGTPMALPKALPPALLAEATCALPLMRGPRVETSEPTLTVVVA